MTPTTDMIATPDGMPPALAMSRRQKAAMIVQMLLRDGQKLALGTLPENTQLGLTRELGALRTVDKITLDAVVQEFAADLGAVALTPPGGIEAALNALGDQISPDAAARLRQENSGLGLVSAWAQVRALGCDVLLRVMERESAEVCAVILSKLSIESAADLLGRLPGTRARRIAYAISQTAAVKPAVVTLIGDAIANDYANPGATAFATEPSQRVGAILNSTGAGLRDSLLEGFEAEDSDFASAVRRAIFTFADIPVRLQPVDVPKAIRAADQDVLIVALAFAQAGADDLRTSADFILSNMSQRMAEQLREEIAEKGKVRTAEGEAAQATVITAIRASAEAGDFALIDPESSEEED